MVQDNTTKLLLAFDAKLVEICIDFCRHWTPTQELMCDGVKQRGRGEAPAVNY